MFIGDRCKKGSANHLFIKVPWRIFPLPIQMNWSQYDNRHRYWSIAGGPLPLLVNSWRPTAATNHWTGFKRETRDNYILAYLAWIWTGLPLPVIGSGQPVNMDKAQFCLPLKSIFLRFTISQPFGRWDKFPVAKGEGKLSISTRSCSLIFQKQTDQPFFFL